MAERSKKRRRWQWVLLVIGVLVACGPIAWRFRPLNALEASVVGRWQCGFGDPSIEEWTLSADRRFVHRWPLFHDHEQVGSWSAANGRVYLTVDVDFWENLRSLCSLQGSLSEQPEILEFQAHEEAEVYEPPTLWNRKERIEFQLESRDPRYIAPSLGRSGLSD